MSKVMRRYDIASPPFVVTGRREPRQRGPIIGFGTGHRNRCFERRGSLLARSDARSDLALALRHQGKLDDAIIEYRRVIEIDQKNDNAHATPPDVAPVPPKLVTNSLPLSPRSAGRFFRDSRRPAAPAEGTKLAILNHEARGQPCSREFVIKLNSPAKAERSIKYLFTLQ